MSKVKITQEQADAIEQLERHSSDDEIIARSVKGRLFGQPYNDCYDRLNELTLFTLVCALDKGYEVEPEFKAGQWIYDITDKNKTVIEVAYVTDRRVHGFWKTQHSDIDTHVAIENARHFTKAEIAKEKERRWWKKHGRDVWEIRQGDVLMATRRHIFEVTADPKSHEFGCYTGNDEFDFDITECKAEKWKVICFRDDRKDV